MLVLSVIFTKRKTAQYFKARPTHKPATKHTLKLSITKYATVMQEK